MTRAERKVLTDLLPALIEVARAAQTLIDEVRADGQREKPSLTSLEVALAIASVNDAVARLASSLDAGGHDGD
jgi:hypothetical protein